MKLNTKRIYSNYTEEEYDLIMNKSREMGFSASAYQKYMSLLTISDRNNSNDLEFLTQEMNNSLDTLTSGDIFIVSSLLPQNWVTLTRSTKMSLSIALKKIITDSPNIYEVVGKIPGKTNQYKKL